MSENNLSDCKVLKSGNDCLVVDAGEFVFKIRKEKSKDPEKDFNFIVRQAFAQEYRDLGLTWDIKLSRRASGTCSIEKRTRLELFSEATSRDEVLKKTAEIRRRVENKLEFPRLLAQLRENENFQHIEKVTLAKAEDVDNSNYARFNDDAIALGETCWFIALLEGHGRWVDSISSTVQNVSLSYGDFHFTDADIFGTSNKLAKVFHVTAKWWMFPISENDVISQRGNLKTELEKMYATNVKILARKYKFPVKTEDDFRD